MKNLFSSVLWSFRLAWKTCPGSLVSVALSLAVIACIPLSQSLLIGNTVSALSGSNGGAAWIYIVALALVVGINIIAQRWVRSNMLILKSKMNYRVHRMLNNRLSTFPLSDIGSTKSQEDIRAAREAISKQELQVHTMSVMTLVSSFAMVFLLCFNIANVSIVAAIFAALCSLPLSIAMVILAKRDYAIYTLMYEDYRVENYYLDNLMAQSRAQELHLMRASRFFSQRVASWRRRAAGRELSLESVRGIISIVAGLLCSVLLFASLYFLVDSGADISYVAGSLIGIITCVNATQEVGYSFGQIINGALSVQQFRRVCDSDTYDHASEIKTSNPNTILKVIPLGSQNKTIPVDQVASVDSSFRLDFKSFAWGIIFALIGLSMMQNSFIGGLILAAYDVLTVLSAFQTLLVLHLTSGGTHVVSVVVFEKANLENCKETIEGLIHNRYNDTNVTKNTDRIIDALNNK